MTITNIFLDTVAFKAPLKKLFSIKTNYKANLSNSQFPVNFVTFLRTPFLTEHFRWLLLYDRFPSKYGFKIRQSIV